MPSGQGFQCAFYAVPFSLSPFISRNALPNSRIALVTARDRFGRTSAWKFLNLNGEKDHFTKGTLVQKKRIYISLIIHKSSSPQLSTQNVISKGVSVRDFYISVEDDRSRRFRTLVRIVWSRIVFCKYSVAGRVRDSHFNASECRRELFLPVEESDLDSLFVRSVLYMLLLCMFSREVKETRVCPECCSFVKRVIELVGFWGRIGRFPFPCYWGVGVFHFAGRSSCAEWFIREGKVRFCSKLHNIRHW